MWLQAGPYLAQGPSIEKKKLEEVYQVMLHTKYQSSRSCDYRQKEFKTLIPRIYFSSFDLVMQWIEAI